MLKVSSRFLRVRLNFHVYACPFIHCLYFIYARKFYLRSQGKITRQWKSTPWEACSVTAFLKAVILWFLLMFLSSLQQLFSYSLSLSCTDVASNSIPRTFAHWTGLDWPGLAWPAGMVILQMTNGHFADESRNGLWESLVLPTSSS